MRNTELNALPTDADRAAHHRLSNLAKQLPAGSRGWILLQREAADALTSCYTGTGENGSPEDVHEARRNGSCRCGYRKPRTVVFFIRVAYIAGGRGFTWTTARNAASADEALKDARAEFTRKHMDDVIITSVQPY